MFNDVIIIIYFLSFLASAPAQCSSESLKKLSEKLADKWTRLVPKLGLTKEQQEEIEKENKSAPDRALAMLEVWKKAEGEGATQDELLYILEGLKMKDLAEGIFEES